MSLFSSILDKLGFGEKAEPTKPASRPTATAAPSNPAPRPNATAAPPAASATKSAVPGISRVDVVAKLESLAASNLQKLNWKMSIVDLLKLLDLDSSLEARKELATELGYPKEKMSDSAQMNIWLHKTVLQKLAENGGNIPKELVA